MGDYTKINGIATGDVVKVNGIANADIVKFSGQTRADDATTYGWVNTGVFDESTVAIGSTSSPDGGSGAWEGGGGYRRMPTSDGGEYDNSCTPFVDFTESPPALKIVDTHHQGDSNDDWWSSASARMSGSQVVVGNHGLCMKSLTGVEFDGDNMVAGDHGVVMITRHDVKNDTYIYSTVVLSCITSASGSLLTAYRWGLTYANGNQEAVSYAFAKAPEYIQWQLEWHKATNTWTIHNEDDDFWEGSADPEISYQTTGSFVGKYIGDYHIRFSDPEDHRVWQIEVEET